MSTPASIKTWDDLLGAVKKLKAAGITPIVVGGADKWPLHFYWSHLAMRVGGKAPSRRRCKGEGKAASRATTFVKAGELFKQLVDLQAVPGGFPRRRPTRNRSGSSATARAR